MKTLVSPLSARQCSTFSLGVFLHVGTISFYYLTSEMLMRVHTRVSSPHAEHSAIKGQQSRVEQSLVLNCLSEVGGFLTNFYWTACSSWVGALLVLSEAVFCLHKLLAPHAVPNTLHKLQAGYLIWRAFFFFFFASLVTAFVFAAWETRASLKCSACIGFKSQQRSFLFPGILIEGSCVSWTQAAGEVDLFWIFGHLASSKKEKYVTLQSGHLHFRTGVHIS